MKIYILLSLTLYSVCLSDVHADIYGRFKTNWMQANEALNSFNNPNMSAPTSAVNLKQYSETKGIRSTFQVVQSRIGLKFNPHKNVDGVIEFDFVDFSQSSPTTTSHPRLRRAFIGHHITGNFYLQLGQDWDLFSNLNPKTFNYIGNYFYAGNLGFMRQQFMLKYQKNNTEFAIAIGQAGKSSYAIDTELETKERTSISVSYVKSLSYLKLAFSTISAKRDFSNDEKDTWGANLGITSQSSFTSLSSEFYTGEGLSKLGLLSLPSTNFGHEYGGYVNLDFKINDQISFLLGGGVANAQNPGTSIFDISKKLFSNLGATRNEIIKMGVSYEIDQVHYFCELTNYKTKYQNEYQSNSTELGMLLYF